MAQHTFRRVTPGFLGGPAIGKGFTCGLLEESSGSAEMGLLVHGKGICMWEFGMNWFKEVDSMGKLKWIRGFCEKREEG